MIHIFSFLTGEITGNQRRNSTETAGLRLYYKVGNVEDKHWVPSGSQQMQGVSQAERARKSWPSSTLEF